jgi:hypothetical protein
MKNAANFRGANKGDGVSKEFLRTPEPKFLTTQTADCRTFFGKTARGSRMLGLVTTNVKSIYE